MCRHEQQRRGGGDCPDDRTRFRPSSGVGWAQMQGSLRCPEARASAEQQTLRARDHGGPLQPRTGGQDRAATATVTLKRRTEDKLKPFLSPQDHLAPWQRQDSDLPVTLQKGTTFRPGLNSLIPAVKAPSPHHCPNPTLPSGHTGPSTACLGVRGQPCSGQWLAGPSLLLPCSPLPSSLPVFWNTREGRKPTKGSPLLPRTFQCGGLPGVADPRSRPSPCTGGPHELLREPARGPPLVARPTRQPLPLLLAGAIAPLALRQLAAHFSTGSVPFGVQDKPGPLPLGGRREVPRKNMSHCPPKPHVHPSISFSFHSQSSWFT